MWCRRLLTKIKLVHNKLFTNLFIIYIKRIIQLNTTIPHPIHQKNKKINEHQSYKNKNERTRGHKVLAN